VRPQVGIDEATPFSIPRRASVSSVRRPHSQHEGVDCLLRMTKSTAASSRAGRLRAKRRKRVSGEEDMKQRHQRSETGALEKALRGASVSFSRRSRVISRSLPQVHGWVALLSACWRRGKGHTVSARLLCVVFPSSFVVPFALRHSLLMLLCWRLATGQGRRQRQAGRQKGRTRGKGHLFRAPPSRVLCRLCACVSSPVLCLCAREQASAQSRAKGGGSDGGTTDGSGRGRHSRSYLRPSAQAGEGSARRDLAQLGSGG
jgi:hypothetical protein